MSTSVTAPSATVEPEGRPPVDPGFAAVLDLINRPDVTPMTAMGPDEARASFSMLNGLAGEPTGGVTTTDRTVPGAAGDVPARVYVPDGGDPIGVLVWFHGGGWVIGDLDSHDEVCRRLALGAGCLVVSVAYRLAPEAPAPAAGDDCWAATAWVAGHLDELGAAGLPIAVGGDSAGGNLAAVVAQRAAAEELALAAQHLVYPCVDLFADTDSKKVNGEGYFLTLETMTWFGAHYLSGGADPADPAISPHLADDAAVAGIAPAIVQVAGYDPLRDEGIAYAERLRSLGVDTELREYPTMIHGFISMGSLTPVTDEALTDAATFLRTRFES